MLSDVTGEGAAFRLSHYFDFIGGTSTGAIISAGLARGWSVATLKEKYRQLGRRAFQKRSIPLRPWSKYHGTPLRELLELEFGDCVFGDEALETLLMVVLHNRTTDSPWPLSNAPGNRYNDASAPSRRNHSMSMADVLAASTAAPAFFPPVQLDFGAGRQEFVDGGVTAHNNPSLQLFLAATLPEFGVGWPTGTNQLFLVSIGTGSAPNVVNDLSRWRRHLLYIAAKTPGGLIFAASNNNDTVCRALAETAHGASLDRMLGGLQQGLATELFRYARYDVELTESALAELGFRNVDASALRRLDAVESIETLMEIGTAYAERTITPAHLGCFTRQSDGRCRADMSRGSRHQVPELLGRWQSRGRTPAG